MLGLSVKVSFKKLGSFGNLLATILTFLTANWTLAASVVIALLTAISHGVLSAVYNPKVLAPAGVFLFVLWTCVGLSILFDRNRPKTVKSIHDYAYALVNEGVTLFFNKNSSDLGLNVGVNFRNFGNGPLKFKLDDFRIVIGDRTVPRGENKEFVMPRGSGRGISSGLFSKDAVEDLKKAKPSEPSGYLELTARYGHPDLDYVRIYKVKFALTIKLDDDPGILGAVENESDEALTV